MEAILRGAKNVSWKHVVTLALFVGGSVVAAAMGSDTLAATLAGAAAGFAMGTRPQLEQGSAAPRSAPDDEGAR